MVVLLTGLLDDTPAIDPIVREVPGTSERWLSPSKFAIWTPSGFLGGERWSAMTESCLGW